MCVKTKIIVKRCIFAYCSTVEKSIYKDSGEWREFWLHGPFSVYLPKNGRPLRVSRHDFKISSTNWSCQWKVNEPLIQLVHVDTCFILIRAQLRRRIEVKNLHQKNGSFFFFFYGKKRTIVIILFERWNLSAPCEGTWGKTVVLSIVISLLWETT